MYRLDGAVFGPVSAKELLELVYSGELSAETPVAPEDGDFRKLRQFGVFQGHLERAGRLQRMREASEAKTLAEVRAQRSRRLRWAAVAAIGVLVGSSAVYGVVRWRREAAAQAEKARREAALEQELARLLDEVSIEPPLRPLVDGRSARSEPRKEGSTRRERSRRKPKSTGVLSDQEVMTGVAKVFRGLAGCIRSQLKRDPESVPGTVVLSFGIDNQGRAKDVGVSDRFLRRSPLSGCMRKQLARARWRAFSGEVRNVEYPITVRRPS